MLLCLILLASSTILAPGQSTPLPLSYADLIKINKMLDNFDTNSLALLFSNGKCQKGTQGKEHVQTVFDAVERRCKTAVYLDNKMEQIRGEFKQQEEGKELKEAVKQKIGRMIQEIKKEVFDYDVSGLWMALRSKLPQWEAIKLEEAMKSVIQEGIAPIQSELDELKNSYLQRDSDAGKAKAIQKRMEEKRYDNVRKIWEHEMKAFETNPTMETAYSMVHAVQQTFYHSFPTDDDNVKTLELALEAFEADLLVYSFLLQEKPETVMEQKRRHSGKVMKTQPSAMELAKKAEKPETVVEQKHPSHAIAMELAKKGEKPEAEEEEEHSGHGIKKQPSAMEWAKKGLQTVREYTVLLNEKLGDVVE